MSEELFYPEQQRALEKLERARGGLVFWKVGTGKTRLGLQAFATLQKVYKWSNPCICLVVCKPKCFYDWRREIMKLDMDCVVLENDVESMPKSVWENVCRKPTFLLVSHAMLDKKFEELDRNRFIRCVILDDGYLFKNPRAAKTIAANKLTLSRKGILLSGSVMTQSNLEDIYGQAFAINQHRRIAPNLTRFRGDFLNYKMVGGDLKKFPVRTPKKGAYEDIVRALGNGADFYFPPNQERRIHHQLVEVEPTPEQGKLFAELREWYSQEEYNIELDYALTVTLRIQQIANGFTLDDNGMQHDVPTNKIDKLIDLVDTILAAGERCIIWCAFRRDVDRLEKLLPFATLQMSGSHTFDIDAWNAKRANVVIATEAIGVGFNHFEQVPYAIYFSMDWKWLNLQQSRGRNDRRGSNHTDVFYYYLMVKDSLDRRIYDTATISGNRELTLVKQGEVADWIKGYATAQDR